MEKSNMKNLVVSALAVFALTSCGGGTASSGTSVQPSEPTSVPSSNPTSVPTSSTSEEDPDVKEANLVLDMINALTEDSTVEEVEAARDAYENLTKRQKYLVDSQGGLEKLEAIEAIVVIKKDAKRVISMIEALDEDNLKEEEVMAAKDAYDEFESTYGEAGKQFISPELVAKLQRCIDKVGTKMIAVWVEKANALDLTKTPDLARFALLSADIDNSYQELTPEQKAKLVGYDEYCDKKEEIGDYVATFGSGYQIVNKDFEEMEYTEDADYGHVYSADLTEASLSGSANLQFYVPPADLSNYDRIGFFLSMPIDCAPNFFNDGEVVASIGNVAANQWKFVTVDVNAMTKPADYSVIAAYFEDLTQAKLDGYKISPMVGFKKTYAANAMPLSMIQLNSEISNWDMYTDTEEDVERGPVTKVDFTAGSARETFQVCWNGIPTVSSGSFAATYQDIYNPTGKTLTNVTMSAITSAWATLETITFDLNPGWNKVSIPATMFEHVGGAMLTATATKDWAADGWKFGRVYATRPSGEEVNFGDLAINSDYTGYAEFPSEQDPEYGRVCVMNLSGLDKAFTVIWNNVPRKPSGSFSRIYFYMYNPTSSNVGEFKIYAEDSSWTDLGYSAPITLAPGWNKVFITPELFTYTSLYILGFHIDADKAPQWKADGWKIANFIGMGI
ncbi:MAG: YkyA family protein [Bacilli bacterium]|nr:YkyA family protein [Bacilli bacterium]